MNNKLTFESKLSFVLEEFLQKAVAELGSDNLTIEIESDGITVIKDEKELFISDEELKDINSIGNLQDRLR